MPELRRLKQLEEENQQFKQLLADLSLDKQMLQDVLRKKVLKPVQRWYAAQHLLDIASQPVELLACSALAGPVKPPVRVTPSYGSVCAS